MELILKKANAVKKKYCSECEKKQSKKKKLSFFTFSLLSYSEDTLSLPFFALASSLGLNLSYSKSNTSGRPL